MKSNAASFLWILLLIFSAYAAPVDEPAKRTSNSTDKASQTESARDELFQRLRKVQRTSGRHDSTANMVDEAVPSPLLGLPSDLWHNSIFPFIAAGNAGNLRLASKEFKLKVQSSLKGFPSVAKACGARVANLLIEQQWPSDYYKPPFYEISDEAKAKIVHECMWATRKWVETLDAPQTIKIKVNLRKANETADFFSDKALFEITKKIRFSIQLHVTRYRGSMEKVFKALSTNECIQTLDFTGNQMGDDRIVKLAATLKNNTGLQSLDLWGNAISPVGAKALADALRTNKALVKLELGSNDIGDEGAEEFATALKVNKKLQHLDLSHSKISHEGVKYLAKAIKVHGAFQYLNLRGNKLRNEGAIYVAAAFKHATIQERKQIYKNSGGVGINEFPDKSKIGAWSLRLHLGMNEIGDDGAIALGEALRNNTIVQTLDLSFNNIGPRGVKALAAALKANNILTKLELESNNAGHEGTAALADALKTNTCLKHLTLQNNALDMRAVEVLASALEINTGIEMLDVRQNDFSKGMAARLRALARRKRIRILV